MEIAPLEKSEYKLFSFLGILLTGSVDNNEAYYIKLVYLSYSFLSLFYFENNSLFYCF